MAKSLHVRGARGVPGCNFNPQGNVKTIIKARHKTAAKPGEVRNPWGQKGKPPELQPSPTEQRKRQMEARKLTELCRLEADDIMAELRRIYKSDTTADTAKLQAMQMVLDRAYGKATQTQVNAQVNADGKPTEIDDSELTRRIKDTIDAVERVKDIAGRAPEEDTSTERPAHLRKLN